MATYCINFTTAPVNRTFSFNFKSSFTNTNTNTEPLRQLQFEPCFDQLLLFDKLKDINNKFKNPIQNLYANTNNMKDANDYGVQRAVISNDIKVILNSELKRYLITKVNIFNHILTSNKFYCIFILYESNFYVFYILEYS